MKWRDRIGIVVIMAIWLSFCGLLQTGNPLTEKPMFRMTIEGLIIGTVVGVLLVISIERGKGNHSQNSQGK